MYAAILFVASDPSWNFAHNASLTPDPFEDVVNSSRASTYYIATTFSPCRGSGRGGQRPSHLL